MKILLSIKPEFVKEIFTGNKKFEYRKNIFKNANVKTVIIYATMPIGQIVGEFSIEKILQDVPSKLWKDTSSKSGISKTFFDTYFKGREKAYALQIGELIEYENPINPYELNENFMPPQSFKYISEDNIFY
ncbi:ASCH domain-containing protein [Bacteroides coprosuis]|uniref:ASCH domain-containing protein n=1 Tax=Bacteroides coprosuis TaxID=151276 RepID=UPI001D6E0B37|nr:ASCH domain-containing protein [Bacteroides coprosuis]HJD91957.1 ASCH domain-containing protein [Bacteroides coprosuis]